MAFEAPEDTYNDVPMQYDDGDELWEDDVEGEAIAAALRDIMDAR